MKNKKILIIGLIIASIIAIIIVIAIPFIKSEIFKNTGKKELIESLQNIEKYDLKQNRINQALEKKWITPSEANNIR